MERAQVRDVMTSEVVSVGEAVTYRQIAALLSEYRISAMPVVDDRRRVLGVVSNADLTRRMIRAAGQQAPHRACQPTWSSDATVAGDLMTSPAVTVEADASLAAAARLMEEHAVERLPVVDRDAVLIGIVSRRDLLRVPEGCDDKSRGALDKQVLGDWFQANPLKYRTDDAAFAPTRQATSRQ